MKNNTKLFGDHKLLSLPDAGSIPDICTFRWILQDRTSFNVWRVNRPSTYKTWLVSRSTSPLSTLSPTSWPAGQQQLLLSHPVFPVTRTHAFSLTSVCSVSQRAKGNYCLMVSFRNTWRQNTASSSWKLGSSFAHFTAGVFWVSLRTRCGTIY